jgi:hypothetical protein
LPDISPNHANPDRSSEVPLLLTLSLTHTRHDRATFQSEGHFVPSNCTGPDVHTLTLTSPGGVQIVRVLAPTPQDCFRLIEEAVTQHIYTSGTAQAQRTYTYEQYQLLVQERGQLADFPPR